MADFYAILRNAIAGLKADNPTNRATLYARAREALDKRLNSLSSPLSTEGQKEQREALEEAVRRIEAESHDPQLAAEGPSSAVMSQPKRSETEEVKDKTQVETTGKARSKGNGTTTAAGTKDAGPIAKRKPIGHRGAPGLIALLALATVANVGAFAYRQWSRIEPLAETSTQPVATDLESDGSRHRPETGVTDVPAKGEKSDAPQSAGIEPIPRRVQTLIVRSDGSVVTFPSQ